MNILQKIIADGRARQRAELVRFLRSYAVHASRPEDRASARHALIEMGEFPEEVIPKWYEFVVQEAARGYRAGCSLRPLWSYSDNAEWRTYTFGKLPAPKRPFAERLYDRIMAFWDRWLPDPDRPRKTVVGQMEVTIRIDGGAVSEAYRRAREHLGTDWAVWDDPDGSYREALREALRHNYDDLYYGRFVKDEDGSE